MVANALLIAITFLLAYGFWLMDQLKFMAPYKSVLFHEYGPVFFGAGAVLFLNVFGAALQFQRKFFLKDTGRSFLTSRPAVPRRPLELPIAPEAPEELTVSER
jgi:hypothetical protein